MAMPFKSSRPYSREFSVINAIFFMSRYHLTSAGEAGSGSTTTLKSPFSATQS